MTGRLRTNAVRLALVIRVLVVVGLVVAGLALALAGGRNGTNEAPGAPGSGTGEAASVADGSCHSPRKGVWWSANFPGGAREEAPAISVRYERLDADTDDIALGGPGTNAFTDEDGWFMIAGLEPDGPGCWRATGAYKGATLSYVYEIPAVDQSALSPTSTSRSTDPAADDVPIELVADVSRRNTSPAADPAAVATVTAGANQFAVEFFRGVAEPTENTIVGNYSLTSALLLTMAGTGGDTNTAFGDLLGVDEIDEVALHPAVNELDLVLESRSSDDVELLTASSLFVQHGVPMADAFLDIAVGSYGAPVTAVDFAGSPDEATAAVDDWVSEETNGFIEQLADGYPPNTAVLLVNAMYLEASWAVNFRRLPDPGAFTTATGEVVQTELMSHDDALPLNEGSDFVAVELPYGEGDLSLIVVQPEDLGAFEADLTSERLMEIASGLRQSGIHLTVPMWSAETRMDALEPLQTLGLPTTFDFSAMIVGGERGYWIDSVTHVARIEVDETGTTAAAASGVMVLGSHGPTVRIDRPFLYFIRDRGSNTILFLGHVVDPSQPAP